MKKFDIIKIIKEYSIVTIGVILVAFGLQYFYSPNHIAGGGLSGLALVINHYVPFLSMGMLMFLGNLILFVISFILVGPDFGAKTIYASFALSFVMDFMEKVMQSHALTTNMTLAILYGTIIIASGLAITFSINASTGGTDILAKILNKYTNFNIGIALLIVDLFVVVAGALTFGLGKGIFSLIAVIVNGLLVDKLIDIISKYKAKKSKEEALDEETEELEAC